MSLLEYKSVLLEVTANPLTVRDMNWIRGCLRHTVNTSMYARMSYPTTMDGGSAGFAGAKTCHAAYGLRQPYPVHGADSINADFSWV